MAKEKKDKGATETANSKLLKLAEKRLKRCIDADEHNRTAGVEDLKFLNADQYGQWDPKEVKRRQKRDRVIIQVNLLPKYVDQIVGEERLNRPQIKIRPVDSKADVHLARIREGIIRNVEYMSRAGQIYDQAFEMAVSCGYGAWRVLTRYTEENPFLQEIYLESVKNPFLVFMDPDCKDETFADAKYGFVLERMSKEDFEEAYPNAKYPTSSVRTGIGASNQLWYDQNNVTVAEYFERYTEKTPVALMSDGTVVLLEEANEQIKAWQAKADEITAALAAKAAVAAPIPPNAAAAPGSPALAPPPGTDSPPVPGVAGAEMGLEPSGATAVGPTTGLAPPSAPPAPPAEAIILAELGEKPKIEETKDTELVKIRRYIINAAEVLEGPVDVPGKYIPLILVVGKERNIEGKRYVRGLIRDAKDAQRLVNYWETATAETVALAPKAPWLVTPAMVKGFENDFANAHLENFPYLKYNPDPDNPMAVPIRNHPGEPPMALFAQRQSAHDNLKQVLGLFKSDVGDNGPERSGPAIIARQTPGDVGTFAFLDNLSRSIAHSGRIINEMIPKVFDTERDVRVRHFNETEGFVPINTTLGAAVKAIRGDPKRYKGLNAEKLVKAMRGGMGPETTLNDITVGKYDVVVSVGPSYTTQRQEAAQNLFTLINSMPDKMGMAADILVENMDFPGSEKLAGRLRKALPANLVELEPGEEPPKPEPPPLEWQVKMGEIEVKKAKVAVERAKLEVQKEKQKVELIKALKESAGARGEVRNMVREILQEVTAPDHPADRNVGAGQGAG